MKKGVSIPINTLVMLAVAIIVLLAAVAWFMGAFSPAATESALKQKFESSCMVWSAVNCAYDSGGTMVNDKSATARGVPTNIHTAYVDWLGAPTYFEDIADACGCNKPYGVSRP